MIINCKNCGLNFSKKTPNQQYCSNSKCNSGKNIYDRVHYWIRKNYGKAYRCEDKDCLNKSERFEWAKLKDKPYTKSIENFMMLCKICHTNSIS